ncbi:uncharacterized protein LOC121737891 [Aricia agestis]|uniref:uncharacterized protein LOC121737891 n=1 Tax=Aricia agestis TaxID=91739 RepID=UPI001C2026E2|nr:uncharacterized protein LOC121737891 [Aricia agestis]
MSQGTCLLCFSVTGVQDIKNTGLQNVYEVLSDSQIQAESHPLCYICFTKLLQCQQLLKQINKENSENQSDINPLVRLSCETEEWSLPLDFLETELTPLLTEIEIKTEYNIKEEYVEGTAIEFVECPGRESKSPAIKEECAESLSHYEAENTGESAYEHIPTKPTQDDTKHYASTIKEESAESPSHNEAESTGESAYEHIPTEPTQDDTKHYASIKKECAEISSHYEAESTGESAYEHIPTKSTQDDTKHYDWYSVERTSYCSGRWSKVYRVCGPACEISICIDERMSRCKRHKQKGCLVLVLWLHFLFPQHYYLHNDLGSRHSPHL